MLNGEIKIYEVKTTLDDLNKLSKQLKRLSKDSRQSVYCNKSKFLDKLSSPVQDSNIGIYCLTKMRRLKRRKKKKKRLKAAPAILILLQSLKH